MSDIIMNPGGATASQFTFANSLLKEVNTRIADRNTTGGKMSPDEVAKAGIKVEYLDKVIAVLDGPEGGHIFKHFSAGVRAEDELDVCYQIFPRFGAPWFTPGVIAVAKAMTPAMDKVLCPLVQVMPEFYDGKKRHRMALVHDRKRSGMDLLEIRAVGLCKLPYAETIAIDFLKVLDETLDAALREQS